MKYSESFPRTSCPTIYGKSKDTLVGVPRAIAEATHNAILADWGLYDTSERKTRLFILWAVDDVWLSKLFKGMPTYYSEVFAKTMLDHLQELCLGNHEVDILVLMCKMHQMYHVFNTIPQYIDEMEKAQKQEERTEMPIVNTILFMMATKAMLETEGYPKAYGVWEDLSKKERKWLKWK